MRYIIATIAACVLLAIAAAFCAHTRQALINHVREGIRQPENAEMMTPEFRAEAESQLDMGILPSGDFEVPSSMMTRIQIAKLLKGRWYFLVPFTFGACFGIARFLVRKKV